MCIRDRFSGVPQLAYNISGHLRIIYVVRDPYARTASHIKHDVMAGRLLIDDVNKGTLKDDRYIDVSNYELQLMQWLEFFPPSCFYVLSFEKYINDRVGSLARVCEFLQLDFNLENVDSRDVKNDSKNKKAPSNVLRKLSRTPLYQKHVKPYIPQYMLDQVRSKTYTKVPVPDYTISNELERHIKLQVNPFLDRLQALVMEKNIQNDLR